MPSKRMTELSVSAAKPSSKGPIDIYDTIERRLVLRVGKTSKTWRLVYRNAAGKIQSKKLGQWPDLDVKTARTNAAAFKIAIREQIKNPQSSPSGSEKSFSDVVKDFLESHVERRGLITSRRIRESFAKVIEPQFEGRAFVSVRRGDVNKLLDKIEIESGPVAADRCLAYVRKLMRWYEANNEGYQCPIVQGMRRTAPENRDRFLSDDEIRTMWRACDQLGVFGALTKMLLLTTQRRTKVASLRWSDIKSDVWTIQAIKREKGTGVKLKLPEFARAVLEAQPRIEGNEFVFPASREGRRDGLGQNFGSFSAFGQGKRALDKVMAETLPDIEHWQLHDLRRTGRTLLTRAGVRPDIAERVLGHKLQGVEKIYNQHDYFKERGQALQKLANLIERIIEGPRSKASRSRKKNRVRVRIARDEGVRVRI